MKRGLWKKALAVLVATSISLQGVLPTAFAEDGEMAASGENVAVELVENEDTSAENAEIPTSETQQESDTTSEVFGVYGTEAVVLSDEVATLASANAFGVPTVSDMVSTHDTLTFTLTHDADATHASIRVGENTESGQIVDFNYALDSDGSTNVTFSGLTGGTSYSACYVNVYTTEDGDNRQSSEQTFAFTTKTSIANMEVTITPSSYVYNGEMQGPTTDNYSNQLSYQYPAVIPDDSAISYEIQQGKNVGTYTVTITVGAVKDANAGCIGAATATYTIDKANLTTTVNATKTYDGTALFDDESLSITAGKIESDAVSATADITVDSANVGTYNSFTTENTTVSLSGDDAGNYTASLPTGTVEITQKTLTADMIGVAEEYAYTGSAIKPEITVSDKADDDAEELITNSDYEISYDTNTDAGTNAGTVTINAKDGGNYTGSASKKFDIVKSGATLDDEGDDSTVLVYAEGDTSKEEKTAFNYGDTIKVDVTVSATGTAVEENTLSLMSLTENYVAVYSGSTLVSDEVAVTEGETATLSVDSTKLTTGTNTLTLKYTGDSNMADVSDTFTVDISVADLPTGTVLTSVFSGYDATEWCKGTSVTFTTASGYTVCDTYNGTYEDEIAFTETQSGAYTKTVYVKTSDDKYYKATVTYNLENIAPMIAYSTPTSAANLVFDVSAASDYSGVESFVVKKVGSEDPISVTEEDGDKGKYTFTITESGTYTITATSVAGNKTTATIVVYAVTFDDSDDVLVLSGGKVTKPADPTKTGYTFSQWEETAGTAFGFTNTTITSGIALTAVYTLNVPTVSLSGGTTDATYGDTVTLTASASHPAISNLTYAWYKDNSETAIAGKTSSTLKLTEVSDSGTYRVVVTATDGELTATENATATVIIAKEGSVGTVTDDATNDKAVYGDTVSIKYTPKKVTATDDMNTMSLMSADEPSLKEVQLWYGDTKLDTETGIAEGTTATLEFVVNSTNFPNATVFDTTADTFTIKWGGDGNLNASSEEIKLTLTKADLAATVKTGDSTATKAYDGDADFTGVALTLTGTKNSDSLTATATGTRASVDVTGSSAFTASDISLSGTNADYYTFDESDVTGSVSITKVTDNAISGLAITNWTYGETANDPSASTTFGTVSYTYSNELEGTYTATVPTNAGTYYVKASVAGTDNYNGDEDTLQFTIAQKSLTLTADDKTITRGQAVPDLTYTADGLVGEDTLTTAPNLACDTANTTTIGEYPITISGAVGANYAITYKAGKLYVVTGYTVTFVENDGEDVSDLTDVAYGAVIAEPTITKSGYTFLGWYADENCTTEWDFDVATVTENLTLYASWSKNSSSNSNNYSQGVSSGTSISGDTVTMGIDVTVSNKEANVTVTEKMITTVLGAKGDNSDTDVVLDVTMNKTDVEQLSVTLPEDGIEELVDAEVESLTITSNLGSVTFDLEALERLMDKYGCDITLVMSVLEDADMDSDMEDLIGNRPVYEITVLDDDNDEITSFVDGTLSISIPYEKASYEDAKYLCVYHIDDDGEGELMEDSKYVSSSKEMQFTTNHLSVYAVAYDESLGEEVEKDEEIEDLEVVVETEFTDITGHWAEDSILYATENGWFGGTTDTTFSPNLSITRGMFVTVLGRIAGVDVSDYTESQFADVTMDKYYAQYVAWAKEAGITSGVSETSFAPNAEITREQMAAMLLHFADEINKELPEITEKNTFADEAEIASWAKDAVETMQMAGIISGRGGNVFDPKGTATRAEACSMLVRMMGIA